MKFTKYIRARAAAVKRKAQITLAVVNDFVMGRPSLDALLEAELHKFQPEAKTFDAGPVAAAPETIVPHPAPSPATVGSKKAARRRTAFKLPPGKIDLPAAAALFDLKPSTFTAYRSKGLIEGLPTEKFGFRVVFDSVKARAASEKFRISRDKRLVAGRRKSAAAARLRSKAA